MEANDFLTRKNMHKNRQRIHCPQIILIGDINFAAAFLSVYPSPFRLFQALFTHFNPILDTTACRMDYTWSGILIPNRRLLCYWPLVASNLSIPFHQTACCPSSTNPITEPTLTYRQWAVSIIRLRYISEKRPAEALLKMYFKLSRKITATCPGYNELGSFMATRLITEGACLQLPRTTG